MYIDAIHVKKENLIKVVERIQGHRVYKEYLADYVCYYKHAQGSYRSIYGDPCKRYSSNDHKKFTSYLNKLLIDGKDIFESDMNPVFRCLENNYLGCDTPKLHVGLFDIETDFDPDKGFASPEDPFNAVTAITINLGNIGELVTLVLCPKTLVLEEAERIANQFDNTYLFDNEVDLLKTFLTLIDDIDLLSGWNCLPLTENIWLNDRISRLGNIKSNDMTFDNGKVINTHHSGMKKSNKITLDNGIVFNASDEHVIPIWSKNIDTYKYFSSFKKTGEEKPISDIKSLLETKDVYMYVNQRKNDNIPYTYRQYLIDNIETFLSVDDFDISMDSNNYKELIKNELRKKGPLRSQKSACTWASKRFSWITIDNVLDHIKNNNICSFVFKNNNSFSVDISQIIPNDVLQLIGMQFTDGTYYRKKKSFTLYGIDEPAMTYYRNVILSRAKSYIGHPKTISRGKDGCISVDYKRSSVFGLLSPMIYTPEFNKKLNIEILSRLSIEQFSAFYSGLIDGDGCISSNNISVCNYDGSTQTMGELLAWNGIYCSIIDNNVRIPPFDINKTFIDSLTLKNSKRFPLVKSLVFSYRKNSPNRKLKMFSDETGYYIKVRSIIEEEYVEMGDIQTEKSYFNCRGVKVHNSMLYDIPYLVNRVRRLMGDEATINFCLWGEKPRKREVIKFKKARKSYDLVGRVHLDYLELYQKHNPQQQQSYKLDAIAEIEVGENKVPYEGTLDELYNKDFYKFIEYSRQDVSLLVKIDEKKKFIELSNQLAHANTVLLKTTMGSVALVEQAIINEMHALGYCVPNRKPREVVVEDDDGEIEEKPPAVGAYVAKPKAGLHDHVGCVDINSLYPHCIIALNMSPETIVGHVRPIETDALIESRIASGIPRAEAWDGLFSTLEFEHMINQTDSILTIDFEDGTTRNMSGAQLYKYIFGNNLCMTANGTIFSTEKDGMFPLLLSKWYAERKVMQANEKEFENLINGIEIDPELASLLKE